MCPWVRTGSGQGSSVASLPALEELRSILITDPERVQESA